MGGFKVNKINWVQKLTSRKFWAAVTGFVTAVLVILKVDKLTMEQIISLISAASVLVAYIVSEGMVDSARVKSENNVVDENQNGGVDVEE